MAIKDRIKEARQNKHLTQEQLASKIGVAKSTLAGYETGIREPGVEIIGKIMCVLNVDANYLWQDEVDFPMQVSHTEMELIKKYRALDSAAQSYVNSVLDWELNRTTKVKEAAIMLENLQQQLGTHSIPSRFLAYHGRIGASGTSVEFSGIASGTRSYPENELNKNADYVISVSDNSMEPEYFNEDIIYVQKTDHIDTGDVGIFQKGNNIYIKKAGKNGLISLNPDYPPLTADGDKILVLGKVLGKAE